MTDESTVHRRLDKLCRGGHELILLDTFYTGDPNVKLAPRCGIRNHALPEETGGKGGEAV